MSATDSNSQVAAAPLPLIVATFGERSMAIPRSEQLFGRFAASIENSLITAFPALSEHTKMAIKIKAPGMKEFAEVLPALWPSVYAIVTEMVVEIPSTPEEMRLHMLTTVGTSLIVVQTPSENYNLKVNILVATGLDLKMIIELYTAVPVERQILNPCIGDEIRDDETLRNSGVAVGRYSNEVTMKIKPKETAPVLDVVVRSG